MASMTAIGTVTRLVYQDEHRQIFSLKTKKDSMKILLSDMQYRVEKGEHITVEGFFTEDGSFGQQLNAKHITHSPVSHDLMLDFLMQGTGIGKAIAERVISAFPINLVDILEQKNIDALAGVERVSRATATVILNQWHKQAGKAKLIPFIERVLTNTPVSTRARIKQSAKKSYAYYGEDTAAKLEEDPYRLWSFGSFKDADLFAKAMGLALDDKRRLICAVEEAIYRKYKEGHTQVYPLGFLAELKSIVGADLAIKAVITANDAGNAHPPRIVIRHEEAFNPTASRFAQACRDVLLGADDKKIQLRKDLYYQTYALPGPAIMEQFVQQQLLLRLEQGLPPLPVSTQSIASYSLPGNYCLSDEQQVAVRTILENPITVISGGAGTGKTSILYAVNDIIRVSNQDILQVALAGKAAQRLIQQTAEKAYTITSLLNKSRSNKQFISSLNTPVFHIDEASMVDLLTIYKVLRVFEGKPIRLVFIGDYAQLPPIGPGLVFHQLMRSALLPVVELKTNYRSQIGIVEVANRVKAGVLFQSNKQVEIFELDGRQNLFDIVQQQYLRINDFGDVHVVGATKKLVQQINITLHKQLRRYDKYIPAAPDFKLNDEVIYKRNNEKLGLVNGSTGKIVAGPSANSQSFHDLVVDFKVEGKKALNLNDIMDRERGEYYLQHAYAITCHSAQGSEFDSVIVVLQDSSAESVLVERSWLYTAITRAKQKVVVIAKRGAIGKALSRGFKFEQINSGLRL